MNFGVALIKVLPFLNLVLVLILVVLFVRMFSRKHHERIYLMPWRLIFMAILVFIVEEILTLLRLNGHLSLSYPYLVVNGFFEMAMVTLFIYALLLQREHVIEEGYHKL